MAAALATVEHELTGKEVMASSFLAVSHVPLVDEPLDAKVMHGITDEYCRQTCMSCGGGCVKAQFHSGKHKCSKGHEYELEFIRK